MLFFSRCARDNFLIVEAEGMFGYFFALMVLFFIVEAEGKFGYFFLRCREMFPLASPISREPYSRVAISM